MKKTVMVGLVLSLLASCGGEGGGADASVKGFLDGIKNGQFDKVAQYSESANGQSMAESFNKMPKEQRELMGLMFSKLNYKINKTDVQGDNATVSLNLTNTDMKDVMSKVMTESVSMVLTARNKTPAEQQKMAMDILKKVLNDSSNKTTSTDTSVKLKKISGKWQIAKDGNEAFGRAFLGGMGDLAALGR